MGIVPFVRSAIDRISIFAPTSRARLTFRCWNPRFLIQDRDFVIVSQSSRRDNGKTQKTEKEEQEEEEEKEKET